MFINLASLLLPCVKADPELEAIRQRRMQELMAQHGTVSPFN